MYELSITAARVLESTYATCNIFPQKLATECMHEQDLGSRDIQSAFLLLFFDITHIHFLAGTAKQHDLVDARGICFALVVLHKDCEDIDGLKFYISAAHVQASGNLPSKSIISSCKCREARKHSCWEEGTPHLLQL